MLTPHALHRGLEMLMLRCGCRHVADGAAPGGDSTVCEKNLVLDALVQQIIEVKLNVRERAEYDRVASGLIEFDDRGSGLIDILRRPLSGVAAGAPPHSLLVPFLQYRAIT